MGNDNAMPGGSPSLHEDQTKKPTPFCFKTQIRQIATAGFGREARTAG